MSNSDYELPVDCDTQILVDPLWVEPAAISNHQSLIELLTFAHRQEVDESKLADSTLASVIKVSVFVQFFLL
jgi:hypothetical protein